MLTQREFEYRRIHGVVPQLDCRNFRDCLSLIPKTPVRHSPFATMGNVFKSANAGKIVGGMGNVFTGMLHLASGNVGYGLGKMALGTVRTATGAIDPGRTMVDKDVAGLITKEEIDSWDRYNFLCNFIPAGGKLGDIYLRDGSCNNTHCGNGYKIYENGDYFEGYWENGEIRWGIYLWANGERYLGNLVDGYKAGYGMSVYRDGSHYDGCYERSQHHGMGTMWYLDGVYCGEWYRGARHGSGACKFQDGTSFIGDWVDDYPVE